MTTTRRNAILGGIAAGTTAWVAPAILTVDAAAAASDNDYNLTVYVDQCEDPSDWTVTMTGPGGYNQSRTGTGSDSVTFSGLAAGEYLLVIDPPAEGWIDDGAIVIIPAPSSVTISYCPPM